MATFNKINSFIEAVFEKKHDMSADVIKVMLTNTAPVATNTIRTDITDLSTLNGYTNGGSTITTTSSSQTSGTYKYVCGDLVFTASGGSIGPFRYVVFYNSTAANGELICWYDYGSAITLANTETFTVDTDQTNGLFTAA